MSKSTYGARRAGLASLSTMALVTTAVVAGAGAASAAADFKFDRIGGQNRYDTSQYVADEYKSDNKDVILANGSPTNYADALSANTLAGVMKSPILLTTRDKTPAPVLKQLQDDQVEKITVVGGPAVVSDEQVAALRADGYTVERVNGDDRFGTNAKIIGMSGTAKGGVGLIATGFNFPDALGAGPFSYQGHPLGLTTRDSIDDEVVSALDDAGVTKVLIFGGTDVVKPAVEAKLATAGITVEKRFAGEDRSETSTLAAEYAVKTLKFTDSHVGIASGYVKGYGADALSGGPLEGKEVAPMLITKDVNNPGVVDDYLSDNCAPLKTGHIYGLQEAISAAQEKTLTDAAQCKNVTTNQDFTVTPAEAATNTVSVADGTNDNRGARQYSVTGLAAGSYDIRLFPASYVKVADNGVVTFRDSDGTAGAGNNEADVADVEAVIEVVNGSARGSAASQIVENVSPVGGSISFTIDSESADSVIPVIWIDEEDDNTVELDANNQPTESFGIGGQKTWVPEESKSGKVDDLNGAGDTDETVESVDKAGNSFITERSLYGYDANDTFYIDSNNNNAFAADEQVTLAEFEAQLSVDDVLDGDTIYQANDALSSTFYLHDVAPDAPDTVTTARQADGRTVKLTFDESDTDTVDSYNVYRAQLTNTEQNANEDPAITDVTCADLASSRFTKIGSVADNDPTTGTFTYTDESTEYGESYCYAVTAVDGDEESSRTAGNAMVTTLDEAPETIAPTITDLRFTNDATEGAGDGPTTIDANDLIRFEFSEDMSDALATDPVTPARFRFTDADGQVFEIACDGVQATCDLSDDETTNGPAGVDQNTAADDVLTVTLVTAPTQVGGPTGGSTTVGAQVPGTLTELSGEFEDEAGNNVDLANSADKVIDNEF